MKLAILTYIHTPFWGTDLFERSLRMLSLEYMNVYDGSRGSQHIGNGEVLRFIYKTLKRLPGEYTHAMYVDAADTIFLQNPTDLILEDNILVYQLEKASYPFPDIGQYYNKNTPEHYRWRYINGGGYYGKVEDLLKFYEQNVLMCLPTFCNGQYEQTLAYMRTKKYSELHIHGDYDCKVFQSCAFEEPDEFEYDYNKGLLYNRLTKTYPCVLHFNGRSDQSKGIQLLESRITYIHESASGNRTI